jgi:hypothetical protein
MNGRPEGDELLVKCGHVGAPKYTGGESLVRHRRRADYGATETGPFRRAYRGFGALLRPLLHPPFLPVKQGGSSFAISEMLLIQGTSLVLQSLGTLP